MESLKREYRLPVAVKTRVSGQNINARLVSQYIRELDIDSESDCEVFYIYDCDVREIVDKLNSLPGTAILTNPCIELWFLLHVRMHARPQTSESIVKALVTAHPCWHGYSKGSLSREQIEYMTSFRNDAVSRAGELVWPGNPSSNFSEFINALEKEKNS
ncbi:MAG: RloB family protein [Duncaniella sp.]|nr:RloB family protein [Duncaniella sp.]